MNPFLPQDKRPNILSNEDKEDMEFLWKVKLFFDKGSNKTLEQLAREFKDAGYTIDVVWATDGTRYGFSASKPKETGGKLETGFFFTASGGSTFKGYARRYREKNLKEYPKLSKLEERQVAKVLKADYEEYLRDAKKELGINKFQ